jgi:hypothetical protein
MNVPSTLRSRVRLTLNAREPDRVPILDLWSGEDAMTAEGSAPRTTAASDLVLLSVDLTPRYPVRILEQDGDTVVRTTPYGGVCRALRDLSIPPEVVDYPVKTRADWDRLARRLEPASERVDWAAIESGYERSRAAGLGVALAAGMGFRACAPYIGVRSLEGMIGPAADLIREMVEAHGRLLAGMAELLIAQGCEFDAVVLFDDLASRRGPRFDASRYCEIFAVATRRLADFLHSHNIRVVLYSPGDLRLLLPELLATGIDCLGPLEVAAGMDLPVLKINYGADLAFLGGIDRRALYDPDPAALEREISTKVRAGMVNGRYIAGFDGPLPSGLPAEQYERASELLATYGKY